MHGLDGLEVSESLKTWELMPISSIISQFIIHYSPFTIAIPHMITWQCKFFSELTTHELYAIFELRNEVFVVEQNCPYQDCDGKDLEAHHIMGWDKEKLIAYSRLLPEGLSYPGAASIGRVVTSPKARRKGLGKDLMLFSLGRVNALYGKVPVAISAQLYLKRFYESFSFMQQSGVYSEDGIPHILMKNTDLPGK